MILPIALVAVMVSPIAVDQEAWGAIDEARGAIRRGMLTEAVMTLEELGASTDDSVEGHRLLLLGNVAFERGRYAKALGYYETSGQSFDQVGDSERAAIARSNQRLSLDRMMKRATLDARLDVLRALVAGCVVVGLTALVMAARRATSGDRAPGVARGTRREGR